MRQHRVDGLQAAKRGDREDEHTDVGWASSRTIAWSDGCRVVGEVGM